MADQWCNPPATLTEFATSIVTSNSVSTSTSLSPSSVASTSTTVITSCLASASGACISSSLVTQTAIIDGVTQVEVPIVITVPVTEVQVQPTRTLYSPCPSNSGSAPSQTSRDNPPSDTPDSPIPSPSPSTTRYSIYTPEPVVSTSVSSFTDTDGSIKATQLVVTETLPPTTVVVAPSSSGNSDHSTGGGGGGGSAKPNAAIIAGSVIGGFLGLLALAGLIWFIMRRRRAGRWDDIFEKEDEPAGPSPGMANVSRDRNSRLDLDIAIDPAPYQYGLVGTRSRSPSPPTSPTTHHTSFSLSAPPGHQQPYVPELYGIAPAHTGSTHFSTMGSAHSRPTTSSSRPTTASSSRPSTANSQMPLNARRKSRGDDVINVPMLPRPPSAGQVPAGYPPQAQHPPLIMTAAGTSYAPPTPPIAVAGYPPAQSPPLMSSPPQSPPLPLQPPLVPINADPGTSTPVLSARRREKSPAVAGPSRPVVVHTDGGRVEDQRVQSPPAPAPAQAEPSRARRKGSASASAPAPAAADPPPPAYTD